MPTSPYKDLIDAKIAEWRTRLKEMEEHKESSASSREELKTHVDRATVQLGSLDEKETGSNTMATKNEILQIFDSVDQKFADYQSKTPFML